MPFFNSLTNYDDVPELDRDEQLVLRPLLGAANLVAATFESLYGIAMAPVDRGQLAALASMRVGRIGQGWHAGPVGGVDGQVFQRCFGQVGHGVGIRRDRPRENPEARGTSRCRD